ncbi:MAG: DUF4294 domain-containing protein [Bacteroidota bacterium]|nr:DUF4294 domain-containing protein [Bacteroidota bacterium]
MFKHLLTIITILALSTAAAWSQTTGDTIYKNKVPAKVIDGDTVLILNLGDVDVYANPQNAKPERKIDERRFWRLVYNLKKVYPYAKLAQNKLEEMNRHFLTLKTESARKDYTKQAEKEIRAQFESELKNLTVTQGRLLIKLIDRQTGHTSYELIKQLRGSLSAFFWQALARLFGSNLKSQYDPLGEDRTIEEILQAIDSGML